MTLRSQSGGSPPSARARLLSGARLPERALFDDDETRATTAEDADAAAPEGVDAAGSSGGGARRIGDPPPDFAAGPPTLSLPAYGSRTDPLAAAYVAGLQAAVASPRPGEDRSVDASYAVRPGRKAHHAAYWYVVYGGKAGLRRWGPSLGVRADAPDAERQARDAFRLWTLQEKGRALGLVAPQDITIAAVAAFAIRRRKPGRTASPRARESYADYVRHLTRFVAHFPGETLGELTLTNLAAYCDLAIPDARMTADPGSRLLTPATLRLDLVAFKNALKAWRAEHPTGWVPQIEPPKVASGRERYVTPAERARLLMACRGYVWDAERVDWLRNADGSRFRHPERERLRREPVRRCMIVQMKSGSRIDAALGLGWTMHPHTGCIDLERGLLHRGGYGPSRSSGKPHLTSAIQPDLMLHLRAWEARDRAAGIKSLIHKPFGLKDRGTQYRWFPYAIWWDIVRDAGIGDDVDPHALCHTCITDLLASGYDPVTVAGLVGRTPLTIVRHYLRWNLAGQLHAVGAGRRRVVRIGLEQDGRDPTRTTRRARRYDPGHSGPHKRPLAERGAPARKTYGRRARA